MFKRFATGFILYLLLTTCMVFGQNNLRYDTVHRISNSTLTDTIYWQKQALTQTTDALVKQIQQFNNYTSLVATNSWTMCYYQVNDTFRVPYLVYVPVNYTPAKASPLYVYLHGGVSQPQFPSAQIFIKSVGLVLQQAMRQNAVIICPLARQNFNWLFNRQAFDAILGQIREVKSRYHINDNKVYIGGHSDGARGAFWFALNQSYSFAASFGICYEPVLLNVNTPYRNLTNGSFYGISAINDFLFSNQQVNQIAAYCQRAGAKWHQQNITGGHDLPFTKPDSIYPLFKAVINKTRNVLPKEIYWETADTRNGRYGWIGITELDTLLPAQSWYKPYRLKLTLANGAETEVNVTPSKAGAVQAFIKNNTIVIKTSCVKKLSIYVLYGLLNCYKPITLAVNNQPPYQITIQPDNKVLVNEFLQTADKQSMLLAKLEIAVP